MPAGTIYVGRGSIFGNPFRIGETYKTKNGPHRVKDAADAVRLFVPVAATQVKLIRKYLRGRDLACWCEIPTDARPVHCHADVLLSIANAGDISGENTRGAQRKARR